MKLYIEIARIWLAKIIMKSATYLARKIYNDSIWKKKNKT
jgi:hypothetical protein